MDSKEWAKANETVRSLELEPGCLKFLDCIRPHHTTDKLETIEHLKAKADICYSLWKQGHHVVTEVWKKDKSRKYDVVDVTECEIYEAETEIKNEKPDAHHTVFINPGERGQRDL